MKKSCRNLLVLSATVIALLISKPLSATDAGLVMPLIQGKPSFADFEDMAPSTALARSMAKVDNFIQRQPDDGDPATQRTEVYIGYDQLELHVIFLAFDSEPEQIRANLSPRENIDGDDYIQISFTPLTTNVQPSLFVQPLSAFNGMLAGLKEHLSVPDSTPLWKWSGIVKDN